MTETPDSETEEYRAEAEAALVHYKPLKPPLTLYRRAEGLAPTSATAEAPQAPNGGAWRGDLLVELSSGKRPAGAVFGVRCAQRHPLLWLVRSEWGLVPVTRVSQEPADEVEGHVSWSPWPVAVPVERISVKPAPNRFEQRFRVESLPSGEPRTLASWEPARPLPAAGCPCHAEVVLTVEQLRPFMKTARRSATYRADGSMV